MEHIAALLLIIGCSGSDCRELPAPVPLFETVEECEAELQPAIGLFTTSHPQVFGKCVEVDPAMEEEDAELVWDINPDGTLYAAIETADTSVMVASTGLRREKDYLSQE